MTTLITSNTQLPDGYLKMYAPVSTEEEADKIANGNKSWLWKEQKLLYVEVKDEH